MQKEELQLPVLMSSRLQGGSNGHLLTCPEKDYSKVHNLTKCMSYTSFREQQKEAHRKGGTGWARTL